MEYTDKIYRIQTDFPPMEAVFDLFIERTEMDYTLKDATDTILDEWGNIPPRMKRHMVYNGYSVGISKSRGDGYTDIYQILWDAKRYDELLEYFQYDFLDDVRNMSEEEFKELFV